MTIKYIHQNHHKTYAVSVDENDMVIATAVAVCHEGDQFCRRTGRVKSAGRLRSARYCVTPPLMSFTEFRKQVLNGEFTLNGQVHSNSSQECC